MSVLSPYRSSLAGGRDGFAQLLRAEWTKFRTVRGWVIGALVGLLLMVGLGVLTTKYSQCGGPPTPADPSGACPAPPTGPGGEWVSDAFYFVRQPLGTSGSITVRVTSLTGLYATHAGSASPGSSGSRSATAFGLDLQIGSLSAQWIAAPIKSLFWLVLLSAACGEPLPNTLITSNGARSSTILAVEKAPTVHPARVKGTQGAGTFCPDGVVSAKVLSFVVGVISETLSVQ